MTPSRLLRAAQISSLSVLVLATSCSPERDDARPESPSSEKLSSLVHAEEAAEEIASSMIQLAAALKRRDLDAASSYFAAGSEILRLPLPGESLETTSPYADHRRWPHAPSPVSGDPKELAAGLDRIVAHFDDLEDFRLQVKGVFPEFSPDDGGPVRIRLTAIGRAPNGSREWLKVYSEAHAVPRGDGNWSLARIAFEDAESLVARSDYFHEVSGPAGVAVRIPPFGEPPNDSFVSHGAAAGDADGDGLIDIAATGLDRNYLYRNRGDGTFENVSDASLVAYAPPGTGILFFDYDADGDQDLFLARVGHQVLLENRSVPDGRLEYLDVSERAGVALPAVGFSAATADVDGNGYPDVYVASYNRFGTVMPDSWNRAANGTRNLLFLNSGDGSFTEAAADWGVDDGRWSYAAQFVDLDRDGDQDLYVANDFGENALYRNESPLARFVDVAAESGVLDRGNGMGVSFGDPDGDGDLDLHVTNMSSSAGRRILAQIYDDPAASPADMFKLSAGNSLYENLGDGTFRDVSAESGPFTAGWAWGGGFVDLDGDGFEDLYTPNGFISGRTMDDT